MNSKGISSICSCVIALKKVLVSFNSYATHVLCRYHPACVDMTIEEAKKLDHFMCSECASDDDVKRSQNGFSASSLAEVKARLFSILFPFFWRFIFVALIYPIYCA